MSDLRTRIAAVAQNHVRCDDCTFAKAPAERYLHFADAVIEALNLKRVNRYGFDRHVTEWEPDE